MAPKLCSSLACLTLTLATALPASGAVLVYDNLGTAPTAGSSDANANAPIFGDALALSQGGTLAGVGFSLFNSGSGGNTGTILAGTMQLKFYDNTVPYSGGALSALPLLGTIDINLDMTGDGGLAAGYYTIFTASDLAGLGLTLPQNIFLTQQFTQTSGTSTRNGFILLSDPVVGSSPNTVYRKSSTITEGLYTFTNNPGQVAFQVSVTPEPATLGLLGLGLAVACRRRRR